MKNKMVAALTMFLLFVGVASAASFQVKDKTTGNLLFEIDSVGNLNSTGSWIAENGVWLNRTYMLRADKIYNTTEEIQDAVGSMVDGGVESNITVTYNDATDKFDFVVTDLYWNTALDVGANEINSSSISFDTTCGAGNHIYFSASGLACEADDDVPEIGDLDWTHVLDDGPLGGENLTDGTVGNGQLANSTITFDADDDGTAISLGGTVTFNGGTNGIDTVNTAGTIVFNFDGSEVSANEINETGISFDQDCAAGNHLFIGAGGNLDCEVDANDGGEDVYVNVTGDSMSGSLVMDAGANINLTSTSYIVSDGTDTYASIDGSGNFLVVLG